MPPQALGPPRNGARPSAGRLPAPSGELIDRSDLISFSFDRRQYRAHPGDTIASALAAAGVKVFSRSFKYHRPRGLLCASGHCPNCLVQVGEEPNVRACRRPVEDGMVVRSQNAWPSLRWDLLSLTRFFSRFLPVGFYYKTFIRPRFLWPLFDRFLRRAAGLGKVVQTAQPGAFDKEYLHTDVAVVGGGPAGLSAAQAASDAGARVLLLDENPDLGGHLRYAPEPSDRLADLRAGLGQAPRVQVLSDTVVTGWYQDNMLSAVRGTRLYKIRAQSVVFATGAYEQPLVFGDNDLPGVMLGSAVQRLIRLYGVAPGKRAVVVAANDDGWSVARDLRRAGVELAALVEQRPAAACPDPEGLDGVPIYHEHTIVRARGSGDVRRAIIARLDGPDGTETGRERSLRCDLITVSTGWAPAADLAYMAGARAEYDAERGAMLPRELPPGIFVAGRVSGEHDVEAQVEEGRRAGSAAAAVAGGATSGGSGPPTDTEGGPSDAAPREHGQFACDSGPTPAAAPRCRPSGKGKQFVCYCEDVVAADVQTAMAEGYDSIELLKRYSTISMGPCQGKMCAANAGRLCACERGESPGQTGRTTSRPPVAPVQLGALAGQSMEPVQRTPLHDWHLERGARMMGAGLWMRPEHYGDPAAEVLAVRRRVGLIDVSTLGKLQLTGPGVPDLLERLYVNRWRRLAPGRARYGIMCDDEGVVLDDGVCARMGDQEWYLSTTSAGASSVYEWIQWWLQSGWGEGVHVVDLTEAAAALNLSGPRARDVLQKLSDGDLGTRAFPHMAARRADVGGAPCTLLRLGFTGELSYEIHCPSSTAHHLWVALMEAGAEFGIAPFGVEAQRILRLEKAHLIVGQDTDAVSDPLAAGMDWAVKLGKPDFLGKRELARVAAAGPRQRLVGFVMARPEAVPEEGLQIVAPAAGGEPEIIGWVTSSRYSPTLKQAIGLCWLPSEVAAETGNTFTIHLNGKLENATVHHGPFYDPAGERLEL